MTGFSRIKVAVVGGGVIGVSTAQQLTQAGADVILLTESALTSGASGRSLAWLNSAGMWREPYHRLRMAGIDRYRTLSAHQPGLRWLRFAGGLVWYAGDGQTILMVTHNDEVASAGDRIVRMRDGKVESDGVTAEAAPASV